MYLPSFNLVNKVTLITGASRGIGRTLAIGMAEAGSDIILMARREKELRKVAQEIEDIGCNAYPLIVDINKKSDVESAIRKIFNKVGRIDILVNNAGINIRTSALKVSQKVWDDIMETNMESAFFMSQIVATYMKDNQRSKIINISSVDGHVGATTGLVYGMSKAALIHMTKVLAIEWAKYNINVNAIGPWYFKTKITEEKLRDPEYLAYVLDRTPMKKLGEFKDLVGATVYFASEASDYITGQTLFVDGGMTAYSY